MRWLRASFIAVAALTAFPIDAAEPPKRVAGFSEDVKNTVKVSARQVQGLMGSNARTGNPKTITVSLGARHQSLCISAHTIDGLYLMTAEFNISASDPGTHSLEIVFEEPDGKRREEMRIYADYHTDEFILRGRVGDSCANSSQLFDVPVSWGDATYPSTNYTVYVNTDGLDAEIVLPRKLDSRSTARVPCQKIVTDLRPRIYDAKCIITVDDELDIAKGRIEISRFGDIERVSPLSILIP